MTIELLKSIFKRILIILPIALVTGAIVGLFLTLLNAAIHFRFEHPWILYLLPAAGLLIHLVYHISGKSLEKGNDLIISEIHVPAKGIPALMAPVIFITTILTHLFGGSAGREGTAVQIGGSIAGTFARWFKLEQDDVTLLLSAGMAAGFGAVFGTPITGAIFAAEVLFLGKLKYTIIPYTLLASFAADYTVKLLNVHHTGYAIDKLDTPLLFTVTSLVYFAVLIVKIVFAAVVFGLASFLFIEFMHRLKSAFLSAVEKQWLIPVIGGFVIIILSLLTGKPDYLSLGVDPQYPEAVTISSAFKAGGAETWSWIWKIIYSTITLGTGFKGGEVTPLFYIGATLGNTLSVWMNAPVSLFAALGFIAVFAGATKTPLSCTIMGAELFGAHFILLFALACFIAYVCSGKKGIYKAQKRSDTVNVSDL